MTAKNPLRKSSHRGRTAVIGSTLAAGAIVAALAVGGPAFADAPTTGTTVSADAGTTVSADAGTSVSADTGTSAAEVDAVRPFFNAGYTGEDAEKLAEQWKSSSVYDAKVSASEKLLDGETLPIKASDADGPAVDAFARAGYTVKDAAVLAGQWKIADVYDAKVTAGEKLAAGEKLPVAPSGAATQS